MSALGANPFAGSTAELSFRVRSRRAGGAAPLVTEAKESRIGKQPVPVPKGVKVSVVDNFLTAEASRRLSAACLPPRSLTPLACRQGPKGKLSLQLDPLMDVQTARFLVSSASAPQRLSRRFAGG
jgi:hypothetical protein